VLSEIFIKEDWRRTIMKLISKNVVDSFTDEEYLYFQTEVKVATKWYQTKVEFDTKYYKYNKLRIESITKTDYFIYRYGIYYNNVIEHFGNNTTARSLGNDGSLYLCYFVESKIYKFDKKGLLIRIYETMGCYDTIYDIVVENNSIWCAYPTSHTIKRFSLETEELEVVVSEGSIGDYNGTIFCYPETIIQYGNNLYVADMGNKRVCKVNLDNYEVEEYLKFDSPVFGYERTKDMEFVWLNSSTDIYIIQDPL